jgi:hypothetical protein
MKMGGKDEGRDECDTNLLSHANNCVDTCSIFELTSDMPSSRFKCRKHACVAFSPGILNILMRSERHDNHMRSYGNNRFHSHSSPNKPPVWLRLYLTTAKENHLLQ